MLIVPSDQLLQKLRQLFHEHNIKDISCNSDKIKNGDAFFAIKGLKYNGNDFIKEAFNKGATIAITDDLAKQNIDPSRIVYVKNVRIALALAAGILYPYTPEIIVAATGTNGKTSVVSYCAQLYSLLEKESLSIGTLGIQNFGHNKLIIAQNNTFPSLTSLDPISFRKILHNTVNKNINYVSFEASSHGLDQTRAYGVKVKAACFTSFSQDHLDYHQDMETYLQAKLKLFTEYLLPEGIAILNSEIEQLPFITDHLKEKRIKFITVGPKGTLSIDHTTQSIYGQRINFTFNSKKYEFETEIIGSFQASNLLIAAMMVYSTGFDIEEIIQQLPKLKPVKGRLERITKINNKFHIFIDYAHTPDALEKTLYELKKVKAKEGLLKVVFGCGGNRDSEKRSIMGKVAMKIANEIIITDDNPRNEEPSFIRQQIIQGITSLNGTYTEIADRKKAIIQTIKSLKKDDILLIAGKGHEEYQIIGTEKIPFSDSEIALGALINQ